MTEFEVCRNFCIKSVPKVQSQLEYMRHIYATRKLGLLNNFSIQAFSRHVLNLLKILKEIHLAII